LATRSVALAHAVEHPGIRLREQRVVHDDDGIPALDVAAFGDGLGVGKAGEGDHGRAPLRAVERRVPHREAGKEGGAADDATASFTPSPPRP
jgi:hypothetical protein